MHKSGLYLFLYFCFVLPLLSTFLLYPCSSFLFPFLSLSISSYSQAVAEIDLSLLFAHSLMCYSLHLPAYLSLFLLFYLSVYSLLQCCRLLWVSGYEVSSYLRQPAVGVQCFPHLGHRYVYMASTLCSPGQAWQNQCLVPSHQQPHWVAAGDFKFTLKRHNSCITLLQM